MDMAFHTSFDTAFELPAGSGSCSGSGRALRPLGWAELCARLVASHDFRAARAIEGARPERPASFHGSAAQWLALLPAAAADRTGSPIAISPAAINQAGENEIVVNPTLSVAGQSVSGIALPEPGGATSTASAHRTESEMSA